MTCSEAEITPFLVEMDPITLSNPNPSHNCFRFPVTGTHHTIQCDRSISLVIIQCGVNLPYRYLSHKFHGKGSGKNKTEKRMKKWKEELVMKQMSSSDTPLQTLERQVGVDVKG